MLSRKNLTGILGGTFNPVHVGHLRLAEAVADALRLEALEFIPCAVPPHKPTVDLLPFEMRISLLNAAIENKPRNQTHFSVSTLERELSAPSYTWNLINAWRERHPGRKPLFILGGEDFANLGSWFRGMELPLRTSLAVVPRGGFQEMTFRHIVAQRWPQARLQNLSGTGDILYVELASGTTCFFLPLPVLDISSSLIRKRWLEDGNIQYLAPDPVIALMHAYKNKIRSFWSRTATCS